MYARGTDMGITRNIRPVVTDGKVNQPDRYVEYWQNKYQELREEKHNIPQHELRLLLRK